MNIQRKDTVNANQIRDKDLIFIKKFIKDKYVNKFITAQEMKRLISLSGSEGHFTYTQVNPIQTWIINHGLKKEPSVMIEDNAGDIVSADIKIKDQNSIEINFSKPFSGKAHLN